MDDAHYGAAAHERIMGLGDQNPHCQFVDRRDLNRLRAGYFDASKAGSGGSGRECGGGFQEVTAFEIVH
jgi:hypothetical protein